MGKILVIEDDPTFVKTLDVYLTKLGYKVKSSSKAVEGVKSAREILPEIILLDYRLPDGTGLEIMPDLMALESRPSVILMTGFSDIRTAVKAMKMGALDYITKPVNPEELKLLLEKAAGQKSGNHSAATSEKSVKKPAKPVKRDHLDEYVEGSSIQAKTLHQHIELVAPTEMTVLILGESGTGKEYVARSIHKHSKRANGPFVAVDCGALSEELAISELFGHVKGAFTGAHADKDGQFVAAKGGTLFLDEVGNLSYEVQVKLLRALQERIIQPLGSNKEIKTDVRIITATNENLLETVRDGDFREDLYHRINEFKIQVPALIERKDDFWEFADFFRENANGELERKVEGFTPDVKRVFESYTWPGNLRELRNVVRRAVLLSMDSDMVDSRVLPSEMKQASQNEPVSSSGPYDLKARKEVSEREMIIKTLEEARYNKSKAARMLNIDRKTLYLKISKYKIDA